MSNIIPISLRKTYELVRNVVSINEIVDTAYDCVHNDITMSTLINKVSVRLLAKDEVNRVNDMSVYFRENLLSYIQENISGLFSTEDRVMCWFDDVGVAHTATYPHIVGETEKPDFNKYLFRECDEPITTVTLKGSNKVLDNNSTDILEMYATVENRVRCTDVKVLHLYSALCYEENKNSISEPMMEYRRRLIDLAEETALFNGYVFKDTRKFDSSSRDYSLNRFGHAMQYGDAFQKYLIQPELTYVVDAVSVTNAKAYLLKEFDVKRWYPLYKKAIKLVDENLALMDKWNNSRKVEFTITGKELGKYMYIRDVVDNIIRAEGCVSRTLVCLDFTNSGGIMFANQFGDDKFMGIANLLGGDKQDAHQAVADYLDIERQPAKKVMQGPNHGARLNAVTAPVADNVFGEAYRGINALAEYGKTLLQSGVPYVELIAPDGVKSYFYGYELGATLDINGVSVGLIAPFSDDILGGKKKGYGFGVKPMHPSDAYIVRHIRAKLIELKIPHLTVLDAFYVPANHENLVANLAYQGLANLRGWFDGELTRIEALTGIPMVNRPKPRTLDIVKNGNIF